LNTYHAILAASMGELKQNILATLAYYDVMDMPLTAGEVSSWLINFEHLADNCYSADNLQPENRRDDIKKELGQLFLDGSINQVGGYYFLFGREHLVPLRLKRQKIARLKWQKAKRAIRHLRFIPYVFGVFASGSLAISNTDELSDLDVLIIVRPSRIWLARIFILTALSLFGVRRKGTDKIAPDKICPNHFITRTSLNIPFKSIYTAQTYCNLVPIYLRSSEIIEEFKRANDWVIKFIFKWNIPAEPMVKRGWPEMLAAAAETIFNSRLGNFFEGLARRKQSLRISQNPVTKESGGRVVFSDEQLEFHPHSIEAAVIKSYNQNLKKLGMPEFYVEQDSGLTR